jgi:hypothetical protein
MSYELNANRLGYFKRDTYKELKTGCDMLEKMLWKSYEKVKTS